MNFSGINYESFADGEGVRVSFFVSGCNRHCPGCFNPEAQDFNYGTPFTYDVQKDVSKHLKLPYIDGITIVGGEPMEPSNLDMTTQLAVEAKQAGKSVWIYTGYTYEELVDRHHFGTDVLIAMTDVLVDGPFIQSLADKRLLFRGSSNQRIIDIPKTRQSGTIVLWDENQSR